MEAGPALKPKFPLKLYLAINRDPIRFLDEEVRPRGDLLCLRLGPRRDYLINNTDWIRDILHDHEGMARSTPRAIKYLLGQGVLTSRGELYREQKRKVLPAFHREKVQALCGMMTSLTEQKASAWRDGAVVDMDEEMFHLTLKVIVHALRGSDQELDGRDIAGAVALIMNLTHKGKAWPVVDSLLWSLPLPRTIRFHRAANRLDQAIYGLIRARRDKAPHGEDLTSLLLASSAGSPKDPRVERQIRDEVLTVFMAGFKTLATALTWTWFLLSRHPEVASRLREELAGVLGGRTPAGDDVASLTYTRWVLAEAMRLYPPVWLMVRRPLRDYRFSGTLIPKGSYVHVSQYLVHRDPRHYEDPLRFDPERFRPENSAKRHNWAYFPFSFGGRRCMGEEFAWTEGTLILATLAQRWDFVFAGSDPVTLNPELTLSPANGMPMRVYRRRIRCP